MENPSNPLGLSNFRRGKRLNYSEPRLRKFILAQRKTGKTTREIANILEIRNTNGILQVLRECDTPVRRGKMQDDNIQKMLEMHSQGKSAETIGHEIGVDASTILKHLRSQGISSSRHRTLLNPDQDHAEILRLALSGVRVVEIAKKYNITPGYAHQIVRDGKLKTSEKFKDSPKEKKRIGQDEWSAILNLAQNGKSQMEIAKIYNVVPSRINQILKAVRARVDPSKPIKSQRVLKIKEEEYVNILEMYRNGYPQREIAFLYSASPSRISQILRKIQDDPKIIQQLQENQEKIKEHSMQSQDQTQQDRMPEEVWTNVLAMFEGGRTKQEIAKFYGVLESRITDILNAIISDPEMLAKIRGEIIQQETKEEKRRETLIEEQNRYDAERLARAEEYKNKSIFHRLIYWIFN